MTAEERAEERAQLWRKRCALETRLRLKEPAPWTFRRFESEFKRRLLTILLTLTGLRFLGERNAMRFKLREERMAYANLPAALEGFRILHLSDFHLIENDTRFSEAMRIFLDGIEADVAVLTGDYCFGHYGEQDFVVPMLSHVLSGLRPRLGFHAVLGNHDAGCLAQELTDAGIVVLVNEGCAPGPLEGHLWIGGVDDPHKFQADSLPLAFAGAPDDAFKIALVHTPERTEEAAHLGAHLYLCGHTHHGQIRLPFFGAIHQNARCASEYLTARWRRGAMIGSTTSGLGNTDLPVRFNCPPEAVRITLAAG